MTPLVSLQPGDLLACYGTGWQSLAIRYGTASPFGPSRLRVGPSHVAIACEYEGRMVCVESTTLAKSPCKVRGKHVSGCQVQDPGQRILDYLEIGGRVEVYRLCDWDTLNSCESFELTSMLLGCVKAGLEYDTGGALISGSKLFKFSRLFPGADLQSLFCSELCAKALQSLCLLNRENPTRFNPACLLRRLVRDGTYEFHCEYRRESEVHDAA